MGLPLQSISAQHFFHLQKFFQKFETELLDASKTVPTRARARARAMRRRTMGWFGGLGGLWPFEEHGVPPFWAASVGS